MNDILSICCIARNESELMPRFFDSIDQAFPTGMEIVIVDTGSTDNTVEYARKRGAKVIEAGDKFSWKFDILSTMYVNNLIGKNIVSVGDRCFFFDQARNEADKHSTKEWILSLDIAQVIEKLDLTLAEDLKTTKSNSFDYNLRLQGGVFSTRRLYRRTCFWEHTVHELLEDPEHIPTQFTDKIAVHHIRKPGANHVYMSMLAHAYFLAPKKDSGQEARRLYYFARELFYGKHFVEARKYFKMCMERSDNWLKERSASACYWGETWQTDDEDWLLYRRKAYIKAISIFPGWREPYLKLADICYQEEDWVGMIGYATQAMRLKEQAVPPSHIENLTNYTTEPFRLKYLGLVRLAIRYTYSTMDPTPLIEEYTLLESKTGCGSNVFILGWDLAFRHYLQSDKKKASVYYMKCLGHDPAKYEREKSLLTN